MLKITLRAARVNKGYTQEYVAQKLNVTKKTVGSWENGTTVPKLDKINSLCELYGIGFDNLFFEKKNA